MQYINFNGTIHPEHEPLLPVTNRAFKYGDSFFETMAMFNRKVPLLDFHWSRLEFTAEVLSIKLPKRFHQEAFMQMLLDLAAVNDAVKNARVRVQLFRKGSGLYLPNDDELGYVISIDKLNNDRYVAGQGIRVGIREDCYRLASMTSDMKTNNALNNVLASMFAKADGWDEMILLNDAESISEAIQSNVFLVKGDKIITPDLDSGCVNGVMRNYIITLIEEECFEERPVALKELLEADEILLTNAVKGVQWVKQFENKTYSNKKAVEFTVLLNHQLLNIA